MKKILNFLLYGIPGLIIGGYSLGSIPRAVLDFSNYVGKTEPYLFWYGVTQLLTPWPFLFLAGAYLFYAFKQDYINRYTNWSVLSWYVAVLIFFVLVVISRGSDESGLGALGLAAYVLFPALFSVVCAHVTGFIKGTLTPRNLNIAIIASAMLLLAGLLVGRFF